MRTRADDRGDRRVTQVRAYEQDAGQTDGGGAVPGPDITARVQHGRRPDRRQRDTGGDMFKPGKKNCVQEQETQEKQPERKSRKKAGNRRRKKNSTLPELLMAAVYPDKRAVMARAWAKRQRRMGHLYTAVRLMIRYMNARERTTIFRNK